MRKFRIVAAALALAVSATAVYAESVWVKAEVADVRGGKAAVYPALGQVKKGQELAVISRDGHWVQVQFAANNGWIYDSSLSDKKVGAGISAGADTAEVSTGIAARGWDADAEVYTQNRHLSTAGMNYLAAIRKSIQPQDFVLFTNSPQGHLGQ